MANEEVGIRLTLQGRREATAGLEDAKDDVQAVGDAAEQSGKQADAATSRWRRYRGVLGGVGRGVVGVTRGIGRGLVGATKAGVVGVVALTAAAVGLSKKTISLAGDARETASAFGTVFGPAARGVQKDLDRLTKRFGLYNPELQDSARQFGVFAKAAKIPRKNLAGFSTDLVRAGLDLSSFYNVDPGEAFAALQSGLSGEAEPLRRFGIFLSDATMKAEAASMGLTDELTEQQKVLVRQRIIMKSLGDAQGDLARTAGGLANQQRGATGRVKTFLTMLGGPLSTAATGAFRGFNLVADKGVKMLRRQLPGLEKDARGVSRTFTRWGRQAAKNLPKTLRRIGDGAKWAKTQARSLAGAWKRMRAGETGDQMGTLSTNVAALGPAVASARQELPGIADALSVANVVTGFLADHVDTLAKMMPLLAAGFVLYKVAQVGANVAAAASVPLKILDIIATRQLSKEMKSLVAAQAGVATGGSVATGVIGAQAGATTGATVAQRGLNTAMRANPIGLVLTAAMLLVGGFVLLYKKSDTFRGMIDGLWNGVLKPFGEWIGGVLVGYLKLVAKAWLMMGRFGIKAFRWLLKAAFSAFDGILSAAEKGLGWVPGLGKKIRTARTAFNEFGDSTINKLDRLDAKLKATQDRIDGVARDRSATITVTTIQHTSTTSNMDFVGGPRRHRARGGGVRAFEPYIVGEHRPELFVPSVPGMIVPRIPDLSDLSDIDMSIGPIGPSGPRVVQLVLPDGRIIMETVLDEFHDAEAHL